MERLLENNFSYKAKDFIFRFRTPIAAVQAVDNPMEPQYDEDGRAYVEYIGKLYRKETFPETLQALNFFTDVYNNLNITFA